MVVTKKEHRTIAGLAKLVGVSVKSMREQLIRLNDANDGEILCRVSSGKGHEWQVNVEALRRAAPHMFVDDRPVLEKLDQLRAEFLELKKKLAQLSGRVSLVENERKAA